MLELTSTFKVVFWKCLAALLERSLALRPLLQKSRPWLPYAAGGIAAFALGSWVGKLLLLLLS